MLLRKEGYRAVLNRDADYALSDDNRWHRSSSRHRRDLSQRKQLSSEIPTKLVVSIHVNWGRTRPSAEASCCINPRDAAPCLRTPSKSS